MTLCSSGFPFLHDLTTGSNLSILKLPNLIIPKEEAQILFWKNHYCQGEFKCIEGMENQYAMVFANNSTTEKYASSRFLNEGSWK